MTLRPSATTIERHFADVWEALADEARARLSSYKLPRRLVLVDVVPRAANGKADYPAAKAIFDAATSSTASAGSPPQAGQ